MPDLAHTYDWLPQPAARRFRLTRGEKEVMRAKPPQTVSEWAQGERYIAVSRLPGPMDNDVVPYARGLMDLFSRENLRELYIAGGSQTAKTDIGHTCLGWAAVYEPGPALIVMQDRDTVSDTVSDRLIPMIEHTPSLRRLLTGNGDDLAVKRIRLRNGFKIYTGWSYSEGRLASKPIRYLYLSEVDLYPPGAIKKARARVRSYNGMEKIIEESTVSVEGGRIWQAQQLAQACLDFWVDCPHCHQQHVMDPANLQYKPESVEPADIVDRADAWYLCPHCTARWDEEDRDEAVRNGDWQPRTPVDLDQVETVWAHISPLISPFVEFRKVVRSYLLTMLDPTAENLRDYYCDNCGLPIPDDSEGDQPQEKELYKRRYDYAPKGASWQLPMPAVFLTADVDVQGDRLECEVVAWGEGEQSWGVEYKTFFGDPRMDDVWNQLHDYFEEEALFEHESGVVLRPSIVGVDCGFLPDLVGKFTKRSPRYKAHKGSNQPGRPLVPKKASKSSKYKFQFYEIGTDTGKDLLFGWLSVEAEGKRHCHFPKSYDYEYFRMLCAEEKKRARNKKTGRLEVVWGLRQGIVRNEALDIRVGNMAMRAISNPNYKALAQRIGLAVDAGDSTISRKRRVKVKRSVSNFTDRFKE